MIGISAVEPIVRSSVLVVGPVTILTAAVHVSALHIAAAAAPDNDARAILPFDPDVAASVRAAMDVHATPMQVGHSSTGIDVGLAASTHGYGPGARSISAASDSRTAAQLQRRGRHASAAAQRPPAAASRGQSDHGQRPGVSRAAARP